MTPVRAWQTVEVSTVGETQVVSHIEIDLARDLNGRGLDVKYLPFREKRPLKFMIEVAQLLSQFGVQAPGLRSLLIIRRGEPMHIATRYPGLVPPQHDGATIVSADAAEAAIIGQAVREGLIRVENKQLRIGTGVSDGPAYQLLQAMTERMWQEERLLYFPAGKQDLRSEQALSDAIDFVLPLSGKAGYLSEEAVREGAVAAFNGGFYITWDDRFADPYTFLYDHIGLVVIDGRVVNAPLYHRSALVIGQQTYRRADDQDSYGLNHTRAAIRRIGLERYAVTLPGGVLVSGEHVTMRNIIGAFTQPPRVRLGAKLNPDSPTTSEVAYYNRLAQYHSGGVTSTHTPAADRIEFTIVGRQICALKTGGAMFIPENGFVVSLPRNATAEQVLADVQGGQGLVEQAIDVGDDFLNPRYALHVAPPIIRDGRAVDIEAEWGPPEEEYVSLDPQSEEEGIPPMRMSSQYLTTRRLARIGFGIHPSGRCYVILVEGCEPRTFLPESDSPGGTPGDLVERLLRLGCRDAVMLDGGGSAQLVFEGRPINRPADRHDVPLLPMERVIPGGWMLFT